MNHTYNPDKAIRCLWNDKEIYSYVLPQVLQPVPQPVPQTVPGTSVSLV